MLTSPGGVPDLEEKDLLGQCQLLIEQKAVHLLADTGNPSFHLLGGGHWQIEDSKANTT